jgi:murein DD-endopeptidase MepM/ murein hydrolase activator NlpD
VIFQHTHPARASRIDLGEDEPLFIANLQKGPPDRRRVSLRWLAGAVLTGIFAGGLIGGALQAAVGNTQHGIVRPALALAPSGSHGVAVPVADKSDRIRPEPEDEVMRRVIPVSTVTRLDDRDLIQVRPFAHVRAALARPVESEIAEAVPAFNPLRIFAEGEPPLELVSSDAIYAAQVDGEVAIRVSDLASAEGSEVLAYDEAAVLTTDEAAREVRRSALLMAEGARELAAAPSIDPARFDPTGHDPSAGRIMPALALAAVPQNVSLVERSDDVVGQQIREEEVVPVRDVEALPDLLLERGATEEEARRVLMALKANFAFEIQKGHKLRIGLGDHGAGRIHPIRVSLYSDEAHLGTVALSDRGVFVPAAEPPWHEALADYSNGHASSGSISVHSGIWRAGLSMGMPAPLIETLIQVLAFDIDLQSRVTPHDQLEVIYSVDDEGEAAEVLHAAVTLAGTTRRYYRFRAPEDGAVDYYDEDGRSARKFLIRKPVAAGRFVSSFGMRRHPILGRQAMHTGVDWAAPRGTPIFAAGNGVVTHAGRKGGYGHHIRIRHANGYETTYSHLTDYASGIREGAEVQQGQVIGYVGSTGLSTGPHLHYEVVVNDRYVDPMKIRLPRGRTLQGSELAAFERERRRIDALLEPSTRGRYAEARP